MPSKELEAEFLDRDYFIRVDPPVAAESDEKTTGNLGHDLFEGLRI